MGRIRVLVVDDHRIFAEALAAALAAEPDVEVGAAGSAAAAERALERAAAEGRAYDVALIDADLGAGAGAAGAADRAGSGGEPAEEARRRPPPTVPPGAVPPGAVPPPRRSTAVPPAPAAVLRPADQARSDQLRAEQARADQLRPAAPPPDGIGLIGRLRRAHPGLRAVVLATADDPRRAARALHAGATGWVAKESSLARLLAVVRGVLRDETHLPPALLTGVIRELTTARRDRTESERLVDTLTPREKQILRCMVAGLGRQAVAERLYLSPHTVRTHMQNVLGKLGVHSTLAAVAVARRAGVGPAEPAAPPSIASAP
ncbi:MULTISPECIES: LuxR C-terminal-related transcriptional regulator [Kitasatospora]|uniref:Response regulator transcription factor n=1 Tax=Kitasatospora cathayae TaxID=3004092 RepID=A0ABY7Q3L1_9ACTN|nr:response regulator transcription factor [Kitasatospora sp. HUAS 3-15]WBP87300.1 response regulator transcription factor [Kitasatospora sp. HUAS 3-15]